jgi:nucleoside-diphosphate-sugar epimerase
LISLGYSVSTFSRNVYDEHKKYGIEIFQGDISRLEEISKACDKTDVVFHTAAKVGIWGSYNEFYEANLIGTANIIDACKKNGVKKLIFTSSASVVYDGTDLKGADETIAYPKQFASHYTNTKAQAEKLILGADSESLKTISLRPHLVWGPGDTQLIPKIIQRAKTGKLKRIGKEEFLIDNTYIDNLVDAHMLAMDKLESNPEVSGKAFFITNGKPMPVWEFLNGIIQAKGLAPVEKSISKKAALTIACALEKLYTLLKIRKAPFITPFLVHELCSHHWFSISAARQQLNYSPGIDFETGLKHL